jgi:hypothetical protein
MMFFAPMAASYIDSSFCATLSCSGQSSAPRPIGIDEYVLTQKSQVDYYARGVCILIAFDKHLITLPIWIQDWKLSTEFRQRSA